MESSKLIEWCVYGYVVFSLFYCNVTVSTYELLYWLGNLHLPADWYGYTSAIQKLFTVFSIPLGGYISDKIGRKFILISTLLLQSITQLLFIYLPHQVLAHAILEAFNGLSTTNIVMLQLILVDRVPVIEERSWWISKATSIVFLSVLIASGTVIYIYDFNHELVWQLACGLNVLNAVLVFIFLPESMKKNESTEVKNNEKNWFIILTSLRCIDYGTICISFCHAVSYFCQLIYVTHYMRYELDLHEKTIGWIRCAQTLITILMVLCYSVFEKCASHMMLMTIGTSIQALGGILTAIFMSKRDTILFSILHIFSYCFTSVVFAAVGSTLSERSEDLGIVLSTNKTLETFAFGLGALVSGFVYTQMSITTPYYFAATFSTIAFVITIFVPKNRIKEQNIESKI